MSEISTIEVGDDRSPYVRKVLIKSVPVEIPNPQAVADDPTFSLTADTYVFFSKENEVLLKTKSELTMMGMRQGGWLDEEVELPWFDPTDYTDEEIVNKVKNLMVFL